MGCVWLCDFNEPHKQTPARLLDFLAYALASQEPCPVQVEREGLASRKPLTSMNFGKPVDETKLPFAMRTVSDYDGSLLLTSRLGAFGRHSGHYSKQRYPKPPPWSFIKEVMFLSEMGLYSLCLQHRCAADLYKFW